MHEIRLSVRLILLFLSAFALLFTSSGVAWADKDYGLTTYSTHFSRATPNATFTDNVNHIFIWDGQMAGLFDPPTSPRTLAWSMRFQDQFTNNLGGPVHCVSNATGTGANGQPLAYHDDSLFTPPATEHSSIPNLRDFYSEYILTINCDWFQKFTDSTGAVNLEAATMQFKVQFRVGKNN